MNNIPYLLALHSINGLGPVRLKAILDYFKDPKLAWEADGGKFLEIGIPRPTVTLFEETRKTLDPPEFAQKIADSGIKWKTVYDGDYPYLLSQIYDPPSVFYYKGNLENWDSPAIGVVGTRKMTGYGRAVTEKFTKALAQAGLVIVSGLARGVDAQAHRVAVQENGQTIAVLGGGLNYIYPPENRELAKQIIEGHGVVMSEFPPDYPSLPGNFPSRNRIISGLSKAVLVTEAAQDSGSLITARVAVEQGREVFAIPGPITSDLSKGPIDLIRQGAKVVFDPQEILEELGISARQQATGNRLQSQLKLSEEEKKVLECLGNETMHIDELARALNWSAAQISATVLKMELTGLIQNLGSGSFCKA